MPAYNEGAVAAGVAREWIDHLTALGVATRFLAIDDGSSDDTATRLEDLKRERAQLEVIRQNNLGHGRACFHGYCRATDAGNAPWVLQIDSDGQCDPADFAALWARREHPACFGFRARRADGPARLLASRALSFAVRLVSRTAVQDANVPYRLMRREALAEVLPDIPPDVELVNVFLAVLLEARYGIVWTPITFQRRRRGSSHFGALRSARLATTTIRQVVRARAAIDNNRELRQRGTVAE